MFTIPKSKRVDIDHIPPEILSEIFVDCLPDPEDCASRNTQVQNLLSSVCRPWRALALATPALWASLDITCSTYVLQPPLPVIRTHLERSGTHPLSFILHAERSDSPEPHLSAVLTALATARQRWRDVHIELYTMTQGILKLIMKGDAPLLQSMQCNVREFHQVLIPLQMLHHCPRLESFHLDSFGAPFRLPRGDTHLTSLWFRTFLSVSECVTLLRLSPRLSSVEFYLVDSDDPPPVPHLTHPTLRTLTATGEYADTLLAALTLPALQDLDLTGEPTSPPTEWDAILSAFLERSKPTLRQLCLSMTRMQSREPALLRILALTPHLTCLRLSDCHSPNPPSTAALVRALHPPPRPGTPLCPRLQKLYLHGISGCPDGLCGAMLRARWGAQAYANEVACLEWGQITVEGGAHDRDKVDVKELYAQGMWITFYTRN